MLSSGLIPGWTTDIAGLIESEMPYLIDGHNLIGAMAGLSLSDLDDEQALIQLLASYARTSRRAITVYFDRGSHLASRGHPVAGVEVRFVKLPRTADDAIYAHLQRLGREAANWTVISSDRKVRLAAQQAGAHVLDSASFASQLSNPQSRLGEDEKPDPQLAPEEIEAWERLFNQLDEDENPLNDY